MTDNERKLYVVEPKNNEGINRENNSESIDESIRANNSESIDESIREKDSEKKLAGEKILDAMGDIRDEFVLESEEKKTLNQEMIDKSYKKAAKGLPKRKWFKFLSAAAILVLCIGVGAKLIIPNLSSSFNTSSDMPEADSSGDYDASDSDPSYSATVKPAESNSEKAEAATEDADASGFGEEHHASDSALETTTGDFEEDSEIEFEEGDIAVEPYEPAVYPQGEAFVLTAGQWNDNDNWPFFTNLVNSGIISFPSFGIDPRDRIKVNLVDEAGTPVANEEVTLESSDGSEIWRATSNKEGIAYLFVEEGYEPGALYVAGQRIEVYVEEPVDDADQQGTPVMALRDEVTATIAPSEGLDQSGVQVMFIVDTTGSMGDELSYLQMDFSQIAADTAGDGVSYSVNFYRDEGDAYVTKTNGFTSNASEVQGLIAAEYAAGGGDTPEAVAQILSETITNNGEWRRDANKVCFLIFDAPPHYGTEGEIVAAVKAAASMGIHMVPVVASNAERETELFGRALAICTDGEYVFLTDDSGVGYSHLEPIVGDYDVELLHDIIVRIINEYK